MLHMPWLDSEAAVRMTRVGQYPGEKEITFPPFTCLESNGDPRVERTQGGEIVVFPLQVRVPPTASKHSCLALRCLCVKTMQWPVCADTHDMERLHLGMAGFELETERLRVDRLTNTWLHPFPR